LIVEAVSIYHAILFISSLCLTCSLRELIFCKNLFYLFLNTSHVLICCRLPDVQLLFNAEQNRFPFGCCYV